MMEVVVIISISCLGARTNIFANRVDLDESLIWIYTVCRCVLDFRLSLVFVNNGRVQIQRRTSPLENLNGVKRG